MMTRSAAAIGIALQLAVGDGGLASDLRTGMQLTYAADGRDQPSWNVDEVVLRAGLKENADCARLRIRRQAGQAEAVEEQLCIERRTLYAWNAARTEQTFELREIR